MVSYGVCAQTTNVLVSPVTMLGSGVGGSSGGGHEDRLVFALLFPVSPTALVRVVPSNSQSPQTFWFFSHDPW